MLLYLHCNSAFTAESHIRLPTRCTVLLPSQQLGRWNQLCAGEISTSAKIAAISSAFGNVPSRENCPQTDDNSTCMLLNIVHC